VALHLVLVVVALVEQGEFEESANIGIQVNYPPVPFDGESLACDVFSDTDSIGKRVTLDHELMRTVHYHRHRSPTFYHKSSQTQL